MKLKLGLEFSFEVILLTIVVLMTNIRSLIFWWLFPETGTIHGEAWREILIWLMGLAIMFYLLRRWNAVSSFTSVLLSDPMLLVFVLYSVASVAWSSAWTVTLHRGLVFAFTLLAAAFLATRYTLKDFLRLLFLIGAVVVVISIMLVFIVPVMGTIRGSLYNGAWRGIFWHKNQLGNILPVFGILFLIRFVSLKFRDSFAEKLFSLALYLLFWTELIFAKSASGYIIAIVLHVALGVFFIWRRVRHLLRPWHYYAVLAFFLVFAAVILFNLPFIFGLFDKNVSLTGRIPMWSILLREVFPQRPWLGYGFGTIWANPGFRLYMRDSAGWGLPILIADNGFIDILLNLGVIGFVLFLFYYVKAWVAFLRYFLKHADLVSFFPVLFLLFTFFANLTFSLFMETEVFVWLILVALMFMMNGSKKSLHSI